MATPMSAYEELAIEYGSIDTQDPNAVNRFFESDVYALPEETRLTIIEKLFAKMEEASLVDVIPEIADEHVPFPNPSDYRRADATILGTARPKQQGRSASLSSKRRARNIGAFKPAVAKQMLDNHRAAVMAHSHKHFVSSAIRKVEDMIFGGEEQTAVAQHKEKHD